MHGFCIAVQQDKEAEGHYEGGVLRSDGEAAACDKGSIMVKKFQKDEYLIKNQIKYFPNNDVYDGQLNKSNQPHGFGTSQFSNGDRYKGYFVNGCAHGHGEYTYKEGSIFQGNYAQDKRQGYGMFHWKNGDKFYGEYKNDKREGVGLQVYNQMKEAEFYRGEYKNSKKDGYGKQ